MKISPAEKMERRQPFQSSKTLRPMVEGSIPPDISSQSEYLSDVVQQCELHDPQPEYENDVVVAKQPNNGNFSGGEEPFPNDFDIISYTLGSSEEGRLIGMVHDDVLFNTTLEQSDESPSNYREIITQTYEEQTNEHISTRSAEAGNDCEEDWDFFFTAKDQPSPSSQLHSQTYALPHHQIVPTTMGSVKPTTVQPTAMDPEQQAAELLTHNNELASTSNSPGNVAFATDDVLPVALASTAHQAPPTFNYDEGLHGMASPAPTQSFLILQQQQLSISIPSNAFIFINSTEEQYQHYIAVEEGTPMASRSRKMRKRAATTAEAVEKKLQRVRVTKVTVKGEWSGVNWSETQLMMPNYALDPKYLKCMMKIVEFMLVGKCINAMLDCAAGSTSLLQWNLLANKWTVMRTKLFEDYKGKWNERSREYIRSHWTDIKEDAEKLKRDVITRMDEISLNRSRRNLPAFWVMVRGSLGVMMNQTNGMGFESLVEQQRRHMQQGEDKVREYVINGDEGRRYRYVEDAEGRLLVVAFYQLSPFEKRGGKRRQTEKVIFIDAAFYAPHLDSETQNMLAVFLKLEKAALHPGFHRNEFTMHPHEADQPKRWTQMDGVERILDET